MVVHSNRSLSQVAADRTYTRHHDGIVLEAADPPGKSARLLATSDDSHTHSHTHSHTDIAQRLKQSIGGRTARMAGFGTTP